MTGPSDRPTDDRAPEDTARDVLEAFNAAGVVDEPGRPSEDHPPEANAPHASDADAPAPPG